MAKRAHTPGRADGRAPERRPAPPARSALRQPPAASPEVQLARARLLGHRPPAEDRLQRYFVIQPGALGADEGATVDVQGIARSKYGSAYGETRFTALNTGVNPKVEAEATDPLADKSTQASSLPPFRVSQSGLLAVADYGQARNLYATPEVVQSSNRVLEQGAADVRLVIDGKGISVPSDPAQPKQSKPRELAKVHAGRHIPADLEDEARTEIAQTFDAMNCDSFIQLVLGAATGASRRAVLQNPESRSEVPAQPQQEPVSELSRLLTQDPDLDPAKAAAGLGQAIPKQDQQQGKIDYEALKPEERSRRAAQLGINEFASPEVGEGFVIRSQETAALLEPAEQEPIGKEEKADGYLQALKGLEKAQDVLGQGRQAVSARVQRLLPTWGEHYAGVVARDEADVVTLENYNRSEEVRWEHERIFNNLFRDFEEFRTLVANKVESLAQVPDSKTIQQLVALAQKTAELPMEYGQALQTAQASFTEGLKATERTTFGNFFFQMYGPGGQSFHAAYQGIASNPVTFHLREDIEPLREETSGAVTGLDDLADGLSTQIKGHPIENVTDRLLAHVQQAKLKVLALGSELNKAKTRAEIKAVDQGATEAKQDLRRRVRMRLVDAYESITEKKFGGQFFSELQQAVNEYVESYSAWQKFGSRYNSITTLQALLGAVKGFNL